MRPFGVVLVLSALLLLGNASLIEHLLNHTHLRGNMHFNTTNGIKLGYNGKLVYDNGFLGVEIANLGASFNAVPKKSESLGNSTNGTVDYNGEIHIAHHHHKSSASVNGTAGIYVEHEKELEGLDGHLAHNSSLTNHAFWTVNASKHEIVGTTGAILNISTKVSKDGDKVYVKKHYYGAVSHDGSYNDTANMSHSGNFTVTQFGRGHIEKKLLVIHDPHQINITGPKHLLPSIAYAGNADFEKAKYVKWNDDKIALLDKGKSLFGGLVWIEHHKDDNSSSNLIHEAKAVNFGHVGKHIVNNKTVSAYGGKGTAETARVAGYKYSKDGNFSTKFFKAGDLHHIGVIKPNPKSDEEIKIEDVFGNNSKKFEDESLEDYFRKNSSDDDDHHPIKTFLHAHWGYASDTDGHIDGDNSTDIVSHGGHIYDAVGFDSKHKEPWHRNGGQVYKTSFVVQPHESEIKDIKLEIGQETKVLDMIRKQSQSLLKHVQEVRDAIP